TTTSRPVRLRCPRCWPTTATPTPRRRTAHCGTPVIERTGRVRTLGPSVAGRTRPMTTLAVPARFLYGNPPSGNDGHQPFGDHASRRLIYYFVRGMLTQFDTEAIYALTAPRPMLMLSGDQDSGAPTDGAITLEKKLGAVYKLHGKAENFRSVVYMNTGHEYLPEMKEELARGLKSTCLSENEGG